MNPWFLVFEARRHALVLLVNQGEKCGDVDRSQVFAQLFVIGERADETGR